MKSNAGYISTQLDCGIAGSGVFRRVAIPNLCAA